LRHPSSAGELRFLAVQADSVFPSEVQDLWIKLGRSQTSTSAYAQWRGESFKLWWVTCRGFSKKGGHGKQLGAMNNQLKYRTMTQKRVNKETKEIKAMMAEDADFLRPLVRSVIQEFLEAEMAAAIGAEKGERVEGRLGYRSGYYARSLITRVGKLELRIPQDRHGRFSTEIFERYQRSEKALVAALTEMYIDGSIDAQGQGD
jgi:hypothetical protein